MDYDYGLQKARIEAKIKGITANVQDMAADPAAVKAFLKTYKIPKQGPLLMPL